MRLILLAPPGAGKGTQAVRLAARFGLRHISTGELFRTHVAEQTPLGKEVDRYVSAGDLVPDALVGRMVAGPVVEAVKAGGYVLDGFPRTLEQAEAAYRFAEQLRVNVQAVIHLRVSDEEVVRRLVARGADEGRTDDHEAVIRHRLELYHEKTEPLLEYYRARGVLVEVDGDQSVDDVTAAIVDALVERSLV